jgi:hypothetical protein
MVLSGQVWMGIGARRAGAIVEFREDHADHGAGDIRGWQAECGYHFP